MKKFLFIVLTSFGFVLNAQNAINAQNDYKIENLNSNSCIVDSSGFYLLRFNSVNMNYEFYKTLRYFYSYNSNGQLSNTLILGTWGNDTTWVNLNYYTNSYDANNNLIDSIFQYWNSTSWVNNTKHAFSYDSNNNCLSVTEKRFGTSGGNWENYLETLNTYDSVNKQTSSKSRQWDYINNFWWDTDSVKYNYDPNNRLISHAYYKSPYGVTPSWSYYGKDTILYNSNNTPYYSFKKYWDSSNNQWRDLQKTSWAYNASNKLIYRSIEDWNSGMNLWQNNITDFYSYDSNNMTIHDSSYVGGGALRYYNNCFVAGMKEIDSHLKNISIYPNPTNSVLSIRSTLEYDNIKIINSIGQTVSTVENKLQKISVSDLSNGIYFIQLLNKKGIVLKTEKFIKD